MAYFFVAWWYDSLIWLDAVGLMDGGSVMVGYVDIYGDGGDENCIYTACDALSVGCCDEEKMIVEGVFPGCLGHT